MIWKAKYYHENKIILRDLTDDLNIKTLRSSELHKNRYLYISMEEKMQFIIIIATYNKTKCS